MRLLTLSVFVLATLTDAAMAFNCSGITLPSSIVICSDPDLTRLADQRQQIYNEARSRLTPDQQNALWEDQKTWVRSYAAACGVLPDNPPRTPVSPSTIECFKRSAEARANYLRTYGVSGNATSNFAAPPSTAPTQVRTSDIDEVALVQSGRLLEIPVQINGAITLNFIIDSGASDVQIPFDVFSTLARANTIEKADLIGEQTYVLADGSKQKYPKFLIRELKIGNHILRNVAGSVGSSTGALLLGQSFLSNFDAWTLDNKRHVLKLVGKTIDTTNEVSSSTSNSTQPGPMASLSAPTVPRNVRTSAQTSRPSRS
jgi:predicted aspartyl protease